MAHTRKSDELLLIGFIHDQGWDEVDLMDAAERLQKGIDEGLQDYSIPKGDACQE
jgi:hypothetical protein